VAKQYDSPPEMQIEPDKEYRATIRTSKGEISVKLYAGDSPATVNNFVFLAGEGFYDGAIFHRVIENFMVQGGDPVGTEQGRPGTGGPGYRFDDELDKAREHRYPRGTLAMANAGPNTNGSQFFIMHSDYGLPPSYSVFGKAVDGLDVLDTIATTSTGRDDRPAEDITIDAVEVTAT
jgi:cyclophilin family peptidyl-prolyl cis-trans isomerase